MLFSTVCETESAPLVSNLGLGLGLGLELGFGLGFVIKIGPGPGLGNEIVTELGFECEIVLGLGFRFIGLPLEHENIVFL